MEYERAEMTVIDFEDMEILTSGDDGNISLPPIEI